MNRWLRALLPYGLLVAIGGPLALILRDYYRDPSRHAGALSWAHPQVWVLSAAGLLRRGSASTSGDRAARRWASRGSAS